MQHTQLKSVPSAAELDTWRRSRDYLIDTHMRLVHRLAIDTARRFRLRRAELADLIGYGLEGLIQAANRFDPSRGNQFSTFAYYRIRGAIIDGVKSIAVIPTRGCPDEIIDWDRPLVDDQVSDAEIARKIRRAVNSLPMTQRAIIYRHYFEGETLAAAGRRIGVSKSWASRQHGRALHALRTKLADAA